MLLIDDLTFFLLFFLRNHKLSWYFNLTTRFRELQSIALEIHQHLLYPHRVSFNHVVEWLPITFLWKADEASQHLNVLRVSFVLLNHVYVFDGSLDIKLLNHFVKLICFYLSVAENVLYIHQQELTAGLLYVNWTAYFLLYFNKLFLNIMVNNCLDLRN